MMAFLDDKQQLEARMEELQQLRLMLMGQVLIREADLVDAKASVAASEGGITELQSLLARYERPAQPDTPAAPETEEETADDQHE